MDHRRTLPPPPVRAPESVAEHHQLAVRPLPSQVLEWLQTRIAQATRAAGNDHHDTPGHDHTAELPRRPAGAGRWVVAVLLDPTVDVEPHAVLGLPRSDVLVLAAPGLCARPEELALLELAQAEERVALCLVMTRQGQPAPAPAAVTPAAQALARRLQPAAALAARSGAAVMPTQARLTAASIVSASEPLRLAAKSALFRTAVVLLQERGDELLWDAPWYDKPLPEEALAEQARAREQQPRAPRGAHDLDAPFSDLQSEPTSPPLPSAPAKPPGR